MNARLRAIEADHAEPILDVLRGYAEMGYSRSDVAGILGYSRPHFTRCVLPAVDPDGSIPWPSRGYSNAHRDGIERRSHNLGWRVSVSRARRMNEALKAMGAA